MASASGSDCRSVSASPATEGMSQKDATRAAHPSNTIPCESFTERRLSAPDRRCLSSFPLFRKHQRQSLVPTRTSARTRAWRSGRRERRGGASSRDRRGPAAADDHGAERRLYETCPGKPGFVLCLMDVYTGARWGGREGPQRRKEEQ